ncbi:uncharacterized protein LOC130407631 isoform X2 [Triplophysa dalaica]|nr:uncharacterized protein LOC130407631 isoform X2 [Triplophysa dalaica]XP_056586697.1 uncharacterized protein LOC130407631 isoform X2 [Triplophysa dalaica]
MFRMNFPLVLLCGLILSCFCSRVAGLDEKISVIQSPDNITVNVGESTEITCCWTQITKEISNVKVVWLKNDTKVSAEIQIYQKSPSENCSTLHIAHISPNDTGEYVCKVTKDIPVLTEGRGNKTILRVNKEQHWNKATTTTDSVHIISFPTVNEKPLVIDKPKTNPKDETSLDGHFVDSSNESSDLWEIVLIYIFRCLPFISLLVAFFSLNRDGRRAIPSKPVEQPEEDLESGNKRRNDAEDVKQDERGSVEEEERDTTEKVKTAEDEKDKQEEEKDPVVLLDTEAVMVITGNREEGADSLEGSSIVSVL